MTTRTEDGRIVLHFGAFFDRWSDDEFFEFCQQNRGYRIERTGNGDLLVREPTGSETGRRNFQLAGQFSVWVDRDGTGVGFDSSTGFRLPDGSHRSPNLSWLLRTRWESLTELQREKFAPLCPDFVVELRSPSDELITLQTKMEEYLRNGARLGWLIDPVQRKVYVYHPGVACRRLDHPLTLAGDPELPGFVLQLAPIW